MIKEWLLAKILKNKIVFFSDGKEYHLINDIMFDGDTVICCFYEENKIDDGDLE